KPQLAKAWRDRFFPGSTFKIVTAAAGLESGKVTPTSPVYPRESSYTPPLTTRAISNFGGEVCGGALFDLLKVSCNSGMA
ncbi:penicillin-binding transpeptidase domain-containing protein, partial [Klebsiella pneumoniae]|nr:penicillin-binding transpeptidase domain-containing protein [Klebsiella pneumoniae]